MKSNKSNRKTLFDYFNGSEPEGLSFLMRKYITKRELIGIKETTLKGDKAYLAYFLKWCEERGFILAAEVSRELLEGFLRHLANKKTKTGEPLKPRSQIGCLKRVRHFFKWLAKERILIYNPAADLEIPRHPQDLPREILSVCEVERILSQPDIEKPIGIRDRAIMEVFYSTGIRRLELTRLRLSDFDPESQSLRIMHGKGGRSRLVPIGKRATLWVTNYLESARERLLKDSEESTLFLSRYGSRFSADALGQIIREYFEKAGIKTPGACHLFRHTMATLMLKNGADVRIVQEILGHRKVTTTQLYTHLTIEHLKKVHRLTHPAKHRKPQRSPEGL